MENNNTTTLDPEVPYGKPVLSSLPKMSDKEFDEIIKLAISTYGKEAQTMMLLRKCQNCRTQSANSHVDELLSEMSVRK